MEKKTFTYRAKHIKEPRPSLFRNRSRRNREHLKRKRKALLAYVEWEFASADTREQKKKQPHDRKSPYHKRHHPTHDK